MKKRQRELRPAAAVDPGVQALFMHGVALHRQGLLDAARVVYEQVLAKQVRHFDALHLQGVVAYQQGDPQGAALSIGKALAIDPDHAGAQSNLGLALLQLRRFDEALESFDRAVTLQPQFSDGHFNRGDALLALGRFEQAAESYGSALAANPSLTKVHAKRGYALQAVGRHAEALDDYDLARQQHPGDAEVLASRGVVLKAMGRLEETLESCQQAIAIDPKLAGAHNTLGATLMLLQRFPEAEAALEQAIALESDHADAHWNKGLALLLQGRLREGWRLYEWRWAAGLVSPPPRTSDQPQWSGGGDLAGKTLLLQSEQGLGDTLQFCRYAQPVNAAGARVVLEVQAPLMGLLEGLEGVAQVIEQGQTQPEFDLRCPLLSLPLAFQTDLDSIPSPGPYLACPSERRRHWAERLGGRAVPRIGLAWAGNTTHARDGERSLPLEDLLDTLPSGLDYVSLQKELRPGDQEALAARGVRHFGGELRDFSETAGLCDQMDLVLSVDTSVAHLAAAMGKPIWIMLAWTPDWRWLLNRSDSPWYDSVTLYRQARRGDWSSVLKRIAEDLRARYRLQAAA